MMTVKTSGLVPADEIHERHMRENPEYAAEYERTRFANEVAIMVLKYRAEHNLTQTALARMLGMRQPHIARLESGEHEPTVSTLARLSAALDLDFRVDVRHGHADIRELADA
jgi:ribosome-binding protein aMBF1 (putative translation factor)